MPVEHGAGDDLRDTLDAEQTIVANDGPTFLIVDADHTGEEIDVGAIDDKPGRLRIFDSAPDETDTDGVMFTDATFDSFSDARLAFGLWQRCGPWNDPDRGDAVPIEVATDGKAAIAAYLRAGKGRVMSRAYVAKQLGVSKQTVSNYWNRVRWTASE